MNFYSLASRVRNVIGAYNLSNFYSFRINIEITPFVFLIIFNNISGFFTVFLQQDIVYPDLFLLFGSFLCFFPFLCGNWNFFGQSSPLSRIEVVNRHFYCSFSGICYDFSRYHNKPFSKRFRFLSPYLKI